MYILIHLVIDMSNLICPKCKKHPTDVYSTVTKDDRIERYRICTSNRCNYHFKTMEKSVSSWNSDVAIEKIKKIVNKL